MIAVDAELIFLDRPIPISFKDPDDAYSSDLIGLASSFWISNNELRADIALHADMDPSAYTYRPEFDDTEWEVVGSDREGEPRAILFTRGRLRALSAMAITPPSSR